MIVKIKQVEGLQTALDARVTGAGSGTINYITKWSSTTGIIDSQIRDDGTSVGINTAPSAFDLVLIDAGSLSAGLKVQNTNLGYAIRAITNGVNATSANVAIEGISTGATGGVAASIDIAGRFISGSVTPTALTTADANTFGAIIRANESAKKVISLYVDSITNNSQDNIGLFLNSVNAGSGNNYSMIVPSGGGNVGLGVSAPTAQLHVVGNLRLVDGTQSLDYILRTDASGNASWVDPSTLITPSNIYNTSDTVGSGRTVGITDTLNFDSNTFVIDGTNNRIGIGTASPSARLDIFSSGSDDLVEITSDRRRLIIEDDGTLATSVGSISASTIPTFGEYRRVHDKNTGFGFYGQNTVSNVISVQMLGTTDIGIAIANQGNASGTNKAIDAKMFSTAASYNYGIHGISRNGSVSAVGIYGEISGGGSVVSSLRKIAVEGAAHPNTDDLIYGGYFRAFGDNSGTVYTKNRIGVYGSATDGSSDPTSTSDNYGGWFHANTSDLGTAYALVTEDGRVGISTTTPQVAFHINSDAIRIDNLPTTPEIGSILVSTSVNGDLDWTSSDEIEYRSVWEGSTNSAAATELFIDGVASDRFSVPTDSVMLFKVSVTSIQTTGGGLGDSYNHVFTGAIRNLAGTTTLLAAVTDTTIADFGGATGWSASVQADDANDALTLTVGGAASDTVKWRATIEVTKEAI